MRFGLPRLHKAVRGHSTFTGQNYKEYSKLARGEDKINNKTRLHLLPTFPNPYWDTG